MIDIEKLQETSEAFAAKHQSQVDELVLKLIKMQIEERIVFLVAVVAGSIVLDSQEDIEALLEGIELAVPQAKTKYLEELGKNLRKQSEQK